MSERTVKNIALVIVLAIWVLVVWEANAFYRYPCQAFKSGILRIGYAPARCIK
jgi:hypothetical protein